MKKIIATIITILGLACLSAAANAELSTAAFKAAQKKCDAAGNMEMDCLSKNGFDGIRELDRRKKDNSRVFMLKLQDGREIEFKNPPKYKNYSSSWYIGYESDSIHRIHLDDDTGEDAKSVEICVSAKDGKIVKCK